jgi:hypothetical protein
MPRFALVELSNMTVLNISNVSNVPPAPPGFRNIVENLTNPNVNEWRADSQPVIGWVWDGQIPAGFSEPGPTEEVPSDLAARVAQLEAVIAALTG